MALTVVMLIFYFSIKRYGGFRNLKVSLFTDR
jgi:hypothetical protein